MRDTKWIVFELDSGALRLDEEDPASSIISLVFTSAIVEIKEAANIVADLRARVGRSRGQGFCRLSNKDRRIGSDNQFSSSFGFSVTQIIQHCSHRLLDR